MVKKQKKDRTRSIPRSVPTASDSPSSQQNPDLQPLKSEMLQDGHELMKNKRTDFGPGIGQDNPVHGDKERTRELTSEIDHQSRERGCWVELFVHTGQENGALILENHLDYVVTRSSSQNKRTRKVFRHEHGGAVEVRLKSWGAEQTDPAAPSSNRSAQSLTWLGPSRSPAHPGCLAKCVRAATRPLSQRGAGAGTGWPLQPGPRTPRLDRTRARTAAGDRSESGGPRVRTSHIGALRHLGLAPSRFGVGGGGSRGKQRIPGAGGGRGDAVCPSFTS
ncbi:uncharacterized protein LOC126001884 [Suncus etruscus]|uniref:uncharacterized protein LOC126001884 n=1 Tax=Suncus etruscus TaxID=109475 RepID=UPI0021102F66|nr:uncharacterized protein LOC126001884 [Suncus etruscus]